MREAASFASLPLMIFALSAIIFEALVIETYASHACSSSILMSVSRMIVMQPPHAELLRRRSFGAVASRMLKSQSTLQAAIGILCRALLIQDAAEMASHFIFSTPRASADASLSSPEEIFADAGERSFPLRDSARHFFSHSSRISSPPSCRCHISTAAIYVIYIFQPLLDMPILSRRREPQHIFVERKDVALMLRLRQRELRVPPAPPSCEVPSPAMAVAAATPLTG